MKRWYRRYTIKFDQRSFDIFGIPTEAIDFEAISQLDGIEYVLELARIGEIVGQKLVKKEELG